MPRCIIVFLGLLRAKCDPQRPFLAVAQRLVALFKTEKSPTSSARYREENKNGLGRDHGTGNRERTARTKSWLLRLDISPSALPLSGASSRADKFWNSFRARFVSFSPVSLLLGLSSFPYVALCFGFSDTLSRVVLYRSVLQRGPFGLHPLGGCPTEVCSLWPPDEALANQLMFPRRYVASNKKRATGRGLHQPPS